MRIILLGAPGVGKGTQGHKLSDFYKIKKLSTGDILRRAVLSNSVLGLKVAEIINKGMLVADEIVEQIVFERIIDEADISSGFILDGFPRTLHQAEALDQVLQSIGAYDDIIILNIIIDYNKLIYRLSNRITCLECGNIFAKDAFKAISKDRAVIQCFKCGSFNCVQREDDKEDTIKRRLLVYDEMTLPLKNYYMKRNGWIEVDGDDTAANIFDNVINLISKKIK